MTSPEYTHTVAANAPVIEAIFERGDGGESFHTYPALTVLLLLAYWLIGAGLRGLCRTAAFNRFVRRRYAATEAAERDNARTAGNGEPHNNNDDNIILHNHDNINTTNNAAVPPDGTKPIADINDNNNSDEQKTPATNKSDGGDDDPVLKDEQVDSLVVWILELVVTTVALCATYALAWHTLATGEFVDRTTTRDLDWGRELAWITNAKRALTTWPWGGQLVAVLYLYEIINASRKRIGTPQQHLLVTHHLLAIMQLALLLRGFMATFDPRLARMLLALLLHMTLEQPIFAALIWYRLRLPKHRVPMLASVAYEVVLRLALWPYCVYVYAELCWLPCTFTVYQVAFRWLFPPLSVLMVAAQVQVIKVHYVLGRPRPPRRESPHVPDAPSTSGTEPIAAASSHPFGVGLATSTTAETQSGASRRSSSDEPSTAAASPLTTQPAPLPPADKSTTPTPASPTAAASPLTALEMPVPAVDRAATASGRRRDASSSSLLAGLCLWLPSLASVALTVAILAVFYGAAVGEGAPVVEVRCRRVAVVGGGAAGLAAAFVLAEDAEKDFDVTVFEERPRLGGAAFSTDHGGVALDHAFHAFRDAHNFENLLDRIGAASRLTASGIAVSLNDVRNLSQATLPATTAAGLPPQVEFTGPAGIASRAWSGAQPAGVQAIQAGFEREASRLDRELARAADEWSVEELMTTTFDAFLTARNFSRPFRDVYLAACLRIYVASSVSLFGMPVGLVRFLERTFSLCVAQGRVTYRNVDGGASAYVRLLEARLRQRGVAFATGSRVARVERHDGRRLRVTTAAGSAHGGFDHVVLAVPRRAAHGLLRETGGSSAVVASSSERRLYDAALGATGGEAPLTYGWYTTQVLNDTSAMEAALSGMRDPTADGCLNVEIYNSVGVPRNGSVLYNMIMLPGDTDVRETCRRTLEPPIKYGYEGPYDASQRSASVIAEEVWTALSHDVNAFRGARALHALQGHRGVWFAGGESVALNLHEHAVASGLVVANAMGAAYPFDGNNLARSWFLRVRAAMLHGLSAITSPASPPHRRRYRCKRCL